MGYWIKADKIVCEDKILRDEYIEIEQGTIKDITSDVGMIRDDKIIDASGYTIIPGLIELHIHGIMGHDTMDGSIEALNEISKELVKNGVTGFVPTTVTADIPMIHSALNAVAKGIDNGVEGSKILGSYVEGPFITSKHKGAHQESKIIPIDMELIEGWTKAYPSIKLMTIAPEKDNSKELTGYLVNKGVCVSIGHTNATYEETIGACDAGANLAVHIFNGMRGLHHREPGVVGAALLRDDMYCELIADNIHVHPDVMRLIVKCKPVDRICLISDCMRAGGLADGEYKLGDLDVIVKDSIPRVRSGSLAGSTLKLIDAVTNMIDIGVEPIDAIHMASLVPAKILGLDDKMGSISKGKKANLTIIDEEYNVVMTIVDGQVLYRRD